MDADRAARVTDELRARGVMAHTVHAGVYEFGIRVVLDGAIEALWDLDGAAGLDAEIVNEGALIGFVPHVPGSEEFTEEQLVNCIAGTDYALDTLQRPADRTTGQASGDTGAAPAGPPRAAPSDRRRQRRAHWLRRGNR
ncbi:hypothetical protein OG875_01010 [Streptomyces sp. NBC_01498]|uniref:hypothetical protein n=1 Tax=Streptomyces sp. NBC_01498 TaxID=2975870 RepID=UPI002E7C483A|nr:hypothetical protein [Streptomyces sp. NBC_01498]WTL23299.1 hypothetical protein OG875_01010 [Streptomyces sp. NBC_01498]